MDIAAAISTGDLNDELMIGEGLLPTVLEMNFDSALYPLQYSIFSARNSHHAI